MLHFIWIFLTIKERVVSYYILKYKQLSMNVKRNTKMFLPHILRFTNLFSIQYDKTLCELYTLSRSEQNHHEFFFSTHACKAPFFLRVNNRESELLPHYLTTLFINNVRGPFNKSVTSRKMVLLS